MKKFKDVSSESNNIQEINHVELEDEDSQEVPRIYVEDDIIGNVLQMDDKREKENEDEDSVHM